MRFDKYSLRSTVTSIVHYDTGKAGEATVLSPRSSRIIQNASIAQMWYRTSQSDAVLMPYSQSYNSMPCLIYALVLQNYYPVTMLDIRQVHFIITKSYSKYAAPPSTVIPMPIHHTKPASIGFLSTSRTICLAFLLSGRSNSTSLFAFAVEAACVAVVVGFMVIVGSICGGL